jgi:hypothetical protein
MDEDSKKILNTIGINFDSISELDNFFIPREQLLSDLKYEEIKKLIPDLKKKFSSSFMTSLQKNAEKEQKWPLLNLVRQILNSYNYKMDPIRKSDGYTLEGVKKYKRFFQIIKKMNIKTFIIIIIMSTDSLINNIDYNTKMDENINILSNDGTILPEDLSYSINIIENQQNSLNLQDKIKLLENQLLRMKWLLIFKIIFFVIIFLVGLLCILYL